MFNNQDIHTLLQFTVQSKFTKYLKKFIFDILRMNIVMGPDN